MSTKLSERILNCIRELATNRAVTDTVWLGNRGITVCEELVLIAGELGGTDDEAAASTEDPETQPTVAALPPRDAEVGG